MTQSLIAQIENRFQTVGQPVSYISADEMAYLQAQARQLRAEAGKAWFDSTVARLASLIRPASLPSGHAVTVK
ncbi:MAG: hypothetical protein VW600_13685 [Ferrovibrio sp.]